MQNKKSQPEGKRIVPETKFTDFPALSVDPRARVSRSASETYVWLFFFTYDIKICYLSFVISFIFDILRRITTFSERHLVFFMVVQRWRHFWNLEFWRHF